MKKTPLAIHHALRTLALLLFFTSMLSTPAESQEQVYVPYQSERLQNIEDLVEGRYVLNTDWGGSWYHETCQRYR